MKANLTSLLVLWAVNSAAVVGLLIYRSVVAGQADRFLHVGPGDSTKQLAVAQNLEWIDRWGKILTVTALLLGTGLAAAYLYNVWIETAQMGFG